VLKQYERGVVFFLGRFQATRGPGLIFVPPLLASMRRVSMRIVAMDIPPQDVITRDNISVKVNAVLYFRVNDPVARRHRDSGLLVCHRPARADDAALGAGTGGAR
jgi:regulator of protease activity HflC (stomatin/prohibitin superfamily)